MTDDAVLEVRRALKVEFLDFREQTLAVLLTCLAAVFAVGHVFILNLG